MLPNPVTVPDAEADPLPLAPPALADADGDPPLHALKSPANPITPRSIKNTDDRRIGISLVIELIMSHSVDEFRLGAHQKAEGLSFVPRLLD
jgi:hypothetical protein